MVNLTPETGECSNKFEREFKFEHVTRRMQVAKGRTVQTKRGQKLTKVSYLLKIRHLDPLATRSKQNGACDVHSEWTKNTHAQTVRKSRGKGLAKTSGSWAEPSAKDSA